MRRIDMSPLPFVIAFIISGNLEETARQAFSATGADAFFLLKSPIAVIFIALSIFVIYYNSRKSKT